MEASAWTWTLSSPSGSPQGNRRLPGVSRSLSSSCSQFTLQISPRSFPDGASVIAGSSVSGEWEVSFEETDVATSEATEFLMDGEEYIFDFMFEEQGVNLGYVEITVSHGETDESGPNPLAQNQCDNAVGQMRMGQVNDFVRSDSTMEGDSGSPNNCPTSYTMIIMLMENYTGQTYQESGQKGELEGLWMDNGFGRGEYRCQITLETRTGR